MASPVREDGSICSVTGASEISLVLPATLPSIDEVDARLCAFLAEAVAPLDEFAVRIILREALLNAVIHGSAEDVHRLVRVHGKLDGSGLTLTVADQGEGFDWRRVCEAASILLDSGRGIPLMRAYASKVVFNEAGNEVTLFRGYAPEATTSCARAGELA